MFETLTRVPDDPILGISAAFKRDTTPLKVDLGVGVYKDDRGNTPVPAAVRRAESEVLAAQSTKTYLTPVGNPGFNAQMLELVAGTDQAGRKGDWAAGQAPGGSGALRLGAELLRLSSPGSKIHVSDPTWANHTPLLSSAGFQLERYPYYSAIRHAVEFDQMMAHLEALPAAAVVLLHACCHNPTGQDLSMTQWEAVADVCARRGLLPYVDIAYQGLGDDLERDAASIRLLARQVPEMLVAVSCSKNFGLYRERTGLLLALTSSNERAGIAAGQLGRLARTIWSMPPDHGAAIVDRVLSQPELRRSWTEELAAMAKRINDLRRLLADALSARTGGTDFSWITRQRGMFSRLDLTPAMVDTLREKHHVYCAPDGRVNIAGISASNVEHVATSIAAVMGYA
ncbi:MAG: amino acid aminotransferase [Steroidobacteraceae bacterium]|nr:aspartate/tyrosine/aromatic aminotransferase [Nevskiaceae bacterium]MCP5338942.1 aspartate/tyrosine/aromatic aminotransferase [Nevskiaceae bacterium]MCP5359645.1 aspartate/tyrosine/aromatic aminotransferase [Nevskiaceae bacterium]MCP5472561.1 aspartate/tyrosine/aromatic aminotransferase [Nevskiaceae bacterium]